MRRILLVAIVASLGLALPARADTRTESYIAGPAGDVDGLCRRDSPAPSVAPNIGAVCFVSLSGLTRVTLTVTDTVPGKVGFWAGFVNGSGTSLGGKWYCATTTPSITITSGAAKMYVYIGGPRAPLEACPNDIGVGTNGTVRAVFT